VVAVVVIIQQQQHSLPVVSCPVRTHETAFPALIRRLRHKWIRRSLSREAEQ
jgi:hypothetical protein